MQAPVRGLGLVMSMCTGICSEGNMEDMPRAPDCCCGSSLFAPLRRRTSSWMLPMEGILQLKWLCPFLYSLPPGPLKRASPSPLLSHCSAPHFVLEKKGKENVLRTGSVLGTSLIVSGPLWLREVPGPRSAWPYGIPLHSCPGPASSL